MSKGLEHLEILENLAELYEHFSFDFTVIEKELKALDIIKNKKVYMEELFESFKDGLSLSYYNNEYLDYHLTQEEYSLLKEVLNEKEST